MHVSLQPPGCVISTKSVTYVII